MSALFQMRGCELRLYVFREMKSKQNRWGKGEGSRNATKKRNKYGKIDKSAGRVDHW